MARVAGVNLPGNKRIDIALTYIYGIGRTLARKILEDTNISPEIKAKDLSESQIALLNSYIENNNIKVEGELRREVQQNIKRLIDIGCYKGIRHRRNLPVHGQRTRSNARTRRGPRKTVGSARPGAKRAKKQEKT